MKNSVILLAIILVVSSSIYAITQTSEIQLTQGKNNITTSAEFKPMYVKDFVKLNPKIDVVSYKEENNTIGYVNIFGGIGENFIMYQNTTYEIITKQNTTLIVQ